MITKVTEWIKRTVVQHFPPVKELVLKKIIKNIIVASGREECKHAPCLIQDSVY